MTTSSAAGLRADVAALLRADRVHPGRAARANLAGASALLEQDDEVLLVLLGELSVFHEFVPVPERATGALLVTDRGIAAFGSTWATKLSCAGRWEDVSSLKAAGGLGGLRVDAVVSGTKMGFLEVYAGKRTDAHRRTLARICSERLGGDGER
ncbi:hypothetical protein NW198_07490 [Thermophilibacter sp. ET337]|uniref:hypothetical protein n=1 Tax=Thermophilibacter sp. ET337 TaxID=2973084 RepID=UPI0021AC3ACB|nr:hypothetical protein [Thermophilibacter sp. ET337]MCR8908451.1 hypothetical protein [Thermophilibacter sp. ET337]